MSSDLLSEGLSLLGLDGRGTEAEGLRRYIGELERWNKRIGLVNATGEELVVKHILDSLAPLNVIRSMPHSRMADIGSGGGLPGIPLAICLPDAEFTLVERSGKKAGFLRDCCITLKLSDRVRVLECDVKDVKATFDIVVFRALGKLSECAEQLFRIAGSCGILAAYKGRRDVAEAEVASIRPLCSEVEIKKITVPFLEEERHLVILKGV